MAEDSGKKTLQWILIAVVASLVVSLLSAGASLFFLVNRARAPKQQVIEPRPELGKMDNLGDFTVNLADTEESHYLRCSIQVEENYGSAPEFGDEIGARKAQLRDIIIGVLTSKTSTNLKTPDGKDALKEELKERINSVLAKGQIANVYFTEFAVQ